MLVLRADPWLPEYGMGFDVAIDEEPPEHVDPFVETDDWSRGLPGAPRAAVLWFVDGVRRIELRVQASDGRRTGPGVFGSYAVGSVESNGHARFGLHEVRRAVVIGGGVQAEPVAVGALEFAPQCDSALDSNGLLLCLQSLMRGLEVRLAEAIAGEAGRLVLADGPLGHNLYNVQTTSPVVGVVKRSLREYLGTVPSASELLAALPPGHRTPLFVIGDETARTRRFSWYVRITARRAPLHDRSGLVRCELRYADGLETARAVADHVAAVLPVFAGRPWDARTPQNVAPIAALEQWLRHRMGDTRLVRRALLQWMSQAA